jgi:type VI secretion system VasD/TssJ family lipoprotein
VRKLNAGIVMSGLSVLLAGCSSAPLVTIPPEWRYEKDAISLHLKADPQLNLFQKNPHTLLLCIYHLRDPNAFNQLQDEKDGVQRLLECGRFDPTVVHARRILLQPGQEIRESLDRAEGAKFINIAAGYYIMRKDRVTRSFPVPLSEETRGGNLVQKPKQLAIDLYLGPQEIQKVQEGK